ncbi:MAG: DinB family protein [Actinomycetota bacterium]
MASGAFDYTQVQFRACPECGHDASAIPAADLAAAVVDIGRRWQEFIGAVTDHPGGVDALCERRDADGWAALEYACHVRDVLSVFARRVELALATHRPELGWWDHERAAADEHYLAQDPGAVADDLQHGTSELADIVQPLHPAAWERVATRQGDEFTVAGLVRFAWHEAAHHLDDARRVVPAPTA